MWTDERVEVLKKLWTGGLSASRIAGELGGVTRNAVIGKVHRLGLAARAKSPAASPPRARKARQSSAAFRPPRTSMRGNTALALTLAPADELDREPEPAENIVPIGQRCTILELTEDKCHWPLGDPGQVDFCFCGGKSIVGLPYCGYHARMAYQPAVDRRRDRRPARV